MAQFLIDDVEVYFPFEPYDEQKEYMKKVIECILHRKVGVLESPTGTGKTLSLLCSSLSWLQKNRGQIDYQADETLSQEDSDFFSNAVPKYLFPRIIYSSRTHSQLSKAMLELQKTAFRNFNVTILGSRDQMCIHPLVMKETNLTLKNALCAMHMKAKSCHFGNNVEKTKKDNTLIAGGITDIEDLITKARKMACCPYYLARELQAKADVIFLPYNYLFDYHIRKALKISLMNAIVILDEAHNIDKVCEEASSVSIKSSDVALALTDVTREMQSIFDEAESGYITADREYTNDELCFVKEKLSAVESVIDEFPVTKDKTITRSGIYIFEILQKAGIDFDIADQLVRISTMVYEHMSNISNDTSNRRGGSLKKLADDLSVIFSTMKESKTVLSADQNFRVYIEEEELKNYNRNSFKNEKPGKVVNYWCFNPGFCLSSTVKEEVRSVILTSGTLAPISSYVKEMALTDPVIVECSHIVENDQVLVLKLESGPRNVGLKCTYANRQKIEYWQEFGLTLQNFFRIIPDGVLIFFPSYSTLNIALKMWRESGLWDKLTNLKPIFIEPQNKTELQQICSDYYKAIDTGRGKGAAFIGVCRGKISEGLDFSDQYGRAVIVAGLPYPPLFDPKVTLKKQYIDQRKKTNEDMSGETWYMLEATKAVNQAIGRVIRHNKDYGAIILCDAQFNNRNIVQNLSKWVQQRIMKARSFGESIGILRSFFRKNQNPMIPSPIKCPESSKNEAVQSTFGGASSSLKRHDLSHFGSNVAEIKGDFYISKPGPSHAPSISLVSETINSKIVTGRPFKDQLKLVYNFVAHYEKYNNIELPSSSVVSKSCLESLEAADSLPAGNKSISSFCLFNDDTLTDKDLINTLNKGLYHLAKHKQHLGPPPPDDYALDYICISEPSDETQLSSFDNNIRAEIKSLIARVQRLNRTLGNDKSSAESENTKNKSLGDICVMPAKRRKIKLQTIAVEDIHLPGSDAHSRAREKRLNDTKDFLLELKALLEPQSYYSLVGLIKKFKTKEDFEDTVKYLRGLFPENDDEFRRIFKRCHLLFSGGWEKEFIQYCESNKF